MTHSYPSNINHEQFDKIKPILESGIKHHIAVDTQGLPHAIHITTANITDRSGALEMFSLHQDVLSDVENVLVDGGYSGDPFAIWLSLLLLFFL